jgi:hypothetical protein
MPPRQFGTIGATAADTILEQVALVDTGGDKRVSLPIQYMTVAVRRDAHVAHQHDGKLQTQVPAHWSIPTGFAVQILAAKRPCFGRAADLTDIRCFPLTQPSTTQSRHQTFSADFSQRGRMPFLICPLSCPEIVRNLGVL